MLLELGIMAGVIALFNLNKKADEVVADAKDVPEKQGNILGSIANIADGLSNRTDTAKIQSVTLTTPAQVYQTNPTPMPSDIIEREITIWYQDFYLQWMLKWGGVLIEDRPAKSVYTTEGTRTAPVMSQHTAVVKAKYLAFQEYDEYAQNPQQYPDNLKTYRLYTTTNNRDNFQKWVNSAKAKVLSESQIGQTPMVEYTVTTTPLNFSILALGTYGLVSEDAEIINAEIQKTLTPKTATPTVNPDDRSLWKGITLYVYRGDQNGNGGENGLLTQYFRDFGMGSVYGQTLREPTAIYMIHFVQPQSSEKMGKFIEFVEANMPKTAFRTKLEGGYYK